MEQELPADLRTVVSSILPPPLLREIAWIIGWEGEAKLYDLYTSYAMDRKTDPTSKACLLKSFPELGPDDEVVFPCLAIMNPYEIWSSLLWFLTASFGEENFDRIEIRVRDVVRWQFFTKALRVRGTTTEVTERNPSFLSLLNVPLRIGSCIRIARFACDPRLVFRDNAPLMLNPRRSVAFAFVHRAEGCVVDRLLSFEELELLNHCDGPTTGRDILRRAHVTVTDLCDNTGPLKTLLCLVRDNILIQ